MKGREVSAEALAQEVGANADLVILDVREPHEHRLCHIAGAVHIPLGVLPDRLNELAPERDIVAYCHHGARSMIALGLLVEAGYERVRSLRGGIDAWAASVEPTMERY